MTAFYFKSIVFLVFIATTCSTFLIRTKNTTRTAARIHVQPKNNIILRELPTKTDLKVYMNSLTRITDFCAANKNDIDLNLALGLFLVNVNLKSVLKHRQINTPLVMLQPIRDLVRKNTALLHYFRYMVHKDKTPDTRSIKAMYSMFTNDTLWMERLQQYGTEFKTKKAKSSFEQLQAIYDTWENYTKIIYDFKKRTFPTPQQSDYCMAALAEQSVLIINSVSICVLPKICYKLLEKGSNSGYALTHRLLLMLAARYGRGCSIYSPTRDREMTAKYCSYAYTEAEYITMHLYGAIDLLMEQISLCSIDGHEEFLRRTWLKKAMERQTSAGCLTLMEGTQFDRPQEEPSKKWKLIKRFNQHSIMGGMCNGHFTATVASALSGGVRFIVLVLTPPSIPKYSSII